MRPWNYSMLGVLTFSWQKSLLYRNQSNDFLYKSMNWFVYDRELLHESVKQSVFMNGLIKTCSTFENGIAIVTRSKPKINSNKKLIFVQISKFRTHCGFKNLKWKHPPNITMKVHSLKVSNPEPADRFSRNLEKFWKLQRERPWWSSFLVKLQICNIFARISLNHLFF